MNVVAAVNVSALFQTKRKDWDHLRVTLREHIITVSMFQIAVLVSGNGRVFRVIKKRARLKVEGTFMTVILLFIFKTLIQHSTLSMTCLERILPIS